MNNFAELSVFRNFFAALKPKRRFQPIERKNMKKGTLHGILTAVFLSVLCIPCAAGVSAEAKTGFSDVDKENPFFEEINLCCDGGVFEGV